MTISINRNIKCINCDTNNFNIFSKYYHGRRLNIKKILICNNCNLKQADFIPNNEKLKSFYNDINTKLLFDTNENYSNHPTFNSFDSYLEFLILKTKINTTDKLNVIDIGAGNGRTLLQVKNLTKWNILGIEPDKIKCKILDFLKLNYINETFQNLDNKLKDNNYDLIIISQVLEHISNPLDLLKRIHSKLKPNGYLWIDVPLCNKNYFSSRSIDDVGHLYFFDEHSLSNLIKGCNFEIIESGSFGKKIKSKRGIISSFLLFFKYYLHMYMPLYLLNLRKKLKKNDNNFKISDIKNSFNKENTKIVENNFENSKLFFLVKKN